MMIIADSAIPKSQILREKDQPKSLDFGYFVLIY